MEMAGQGVPPIIIVNPSTGLKIPDTLHRIWPSYTRFGQRPPRFNLEEVVERLRDIRNYAIDHLDSLVQRLMETLKRYPGVDLIYANNAEEAVEAIKRICGSSRRISVNNSNTVDELRELLVKEGFELEETYYLQFEGFAPIRERRQNRRVRG